MPGMADETIFDAPEEDTSPEDAANEDAPVAEPSVTPAPTESVSVVEDASEPDYIVALSPDSTLETPLAVSVPGLKESGAKVDKEGRLVLDDEPVTVPAAAARNLEGLPYLDVSVKR